MEDDEESPARHTPQLGGSRMKLPTVTVAARPQHTLTLALPIQQQPPPQQQQPRAVGGGREDCWSEGATAQLIDAWGERYLELSRGNLKQKHWQEVADSVTSREDYTKTPKTDIQCKNRIDTLKKKYKTEKARILSGAASSNWHFFHKLDYLIGPSKRTAPAAVAASDGGVGGGSSATPTPMIQGHTNSKLPVGIPVRTFLHFQQQQQQHNYGNSESSKSDEVSLGSTDSLPPPSTMNAKRRKVEMGRSGGNTMNSLQELARAITKFGEVYERTESSKLQQVIELDKERMGFARELELQRMQFFVKTQLELTQLKHGRVGNNNNTG